MIGSDDGVARVDRAPHAARASGGLEGVHGVAVGQFTAYDGSGASGWSIVDVLEDQLGGLGVPVCGGFTLGHGRRPRTVPLGTRACSTSPPARCASEGAVRAPYVDRRRAMIAAAGVCTAGGS